MFAWTVVKILLARVLLGDEFVDQLNLCDLVPGGNTPRDERPSPKKWRSSSPEPASTVMVAGIFFEWGGHAQYFYKFFKDFEFFHPSKYSKRLATSLSHF
jgi:hypothetical protein